eukprot:Opistho-1_new@27784
MFTGSTADNSSGCMPMVRCGDVHGIQFFVLNCFAKIIFAFGDGFTGFYYRIKPFLTGFFIHVADKIYLGIFLFGKNACKGCSPAIATNDRHMNPIIGTYNSVITFSTKYL